MIKGRIFILNVLIVLSFVGGGYASDVDSVSSCQSDYASSSGSSDTISFGGGRSSSNCSDESWGSFDFNGVDGRLPENYYFYCVHHNKKAAHYLPKTKELEQSIREGSLTSDWNSKWFPLCKSFEGFLQATGKKSKTAVHSGVMCWGIVAELVHERTTDGFAKESTANVIKARDDFYDRD